MKPFTKILLTTMKKAALNLRIFTQPNQPIFENDLIND